MWCKTSKVMILLFLRVTGLWQKPDAQKPPSQTALDKCFLYRDTVLLREPRAVYTPLAPRNLCVNVWLFIQCALYPISALEKERKEERGERQPFKLRLVVS